MRIFFPRFQRTFLNLGDVGRHPQFKHLEAPPDGFKFETKNLSWFAWLSQFPIKLRETVEVWRETLKFASDNGLSTRTALHFLWSRRIGRFIPAPADCGATFLPTYPLTQQTEKWFLEIEDVTTLFIPYAWNGQTKSVKVRELKTFPLIKKWLESPKCLGILTHVHSTRDSIKKIFDSEIINSKTLSAHVPYIPKQVVNETELDDLRGPGPIRFFFNNSWHQYHANFYLRGGLSIIEAFSKAFDEGLPVKLILRSRLPRAVMRDYAEFLNSPSVIWLDEFLGFEEYIRLLRSSHYYLLPSARLHVVSILESMYHGAVPIVSDGWGLEEYVKHNENAFVVPGIYGKVSWVDLTSGELREDYRPMHEKPGIISDGLYETIKRAVELKDRAQMALNAHRKVRDEGNIDRFNLEFGMFLKRGVQLAE